MQDGINNEQMLGQNLSHMNMPKAFPFVGKKFPPIISQNMNFSLSLTHTC